MDQRQRKQIINKETDTYLWDNTYPLFRQPTPWYESTSPDLSHSPIINNKNTMDTEFLVQMRQSNKCGSVRHDKIFYLHLGSGVSPSLSRSCLLRDTSHTYWFHPPKQLTIKKQRTQKWNPTTNKSYCTALVYIHRTQD